jgi:amino acid transporter
MNPPTPGLTPCFSQQNCPSNEIQEGTTPLFQRILRRLDLTLFSVCAILVLDGLSASASIGVSSLSWYLVILVLFFIPYGLIIAELGSAYPEQGGIYVWIRHAFGPRWAARATWCYWVSVPLGIPSVYVLFAGIFAQLFIPSLDRAGIIGIALGLTWITVGVGVVRLELGRWVPNLGALLKAIVILTLGAGGIIFALHQGPANDLSLPSLLPHWNAGLAFLPVVLFNFLGFELVSGAGEEIVHPRHDLPVAILLSGGLIAFFYIFATLGMVLALPISQLGLVQGIVGTLQAIFGRAGAGRLFVNGLGIMVLATFFATMVTWSLGTNRSAAQAAEEGNLPPIFGHLDPVRKTPVGATLIGGAIATMVLLAYGLLGESNDQFFWSLFAFASIVFLLPYLLLFPAFLRLRASDPKTPRRYRFPGGKIMAWGAAGICLLFVIQGVVFFIWVPGLPVEWSFALPVLAGVVLTLAAGELLVRTQS